MYFFPLPPVVIRDLSCLLGIDSRRTASHFFTLEPSLRMRVCPLLWFYVFVFVSPPRPSPRFLSLCADLFLFHLFSHRVSPHPFVRNTTGFIRNFQRCQQPTAWATRPRSTSGRNCQAFLSTAARATDELVLPIGAKRA